jgi:hypothetical protein
MSAGAENTSSGANIDVTDLLVGKADSMVVVSTFSTEDIVPLGCITVNKLFHSNGKETLTALGVK